MLKASILLRQGDLSGCGVQSDTKQNRAKPYHRVSLWHPQAQVISFVDGWAFHSCTYYYRKPLFRLTSIVEIKIWLKSLVEIVKAWDWYVIIISVTTAFTFWVFNALNDEHTANIRYPIDIRYEKPNIVALIPPPERVNVNITGQGWNVLQKSLGFDLEPIPLLIDVENSIFMRYINVKPHLFYKVNKMLKDVRVNYVLEDSLACSFDTLTYKKIYFRINKENISLKEHHQIVSDISIRPDHVKIKGPSSVLLEYDDSIWLEVDEEEIDESFHEEVFFECEEQAFVSFPYEKAFVNFEVALFVKKILPLKIVRVNFEKNQQLTLDPNEGYLQVYVNSRQLLQPRDSIKAVVDFDDFNANDSTILPQITLPEEFHEAVIHPEKFMLKTTAPCCK